MKNAQSKINLCWWKQYHESKLEEVNNLIDFDYKLQSGYTFNNTFYLGTTDFGMLVVPFGTSQAEQILPDGPLFNQAFAIDASPGQLWVAFGEIDLNFNPYPLTKRGISNFRNDDWLSIKYDDLKGEVNRPYTYEVKTGDKLINLKK